MNIGYPFLLDVAVIGIFIGGIRLFRRPEQGRTGNLVAASGLLGALVLVLCRNVILQPGTVIGAALAGSAIGWILAVRVDMLQIPAMVAFQHGAGGVAAFLISFVELTWGAAQLAPVNRISGVIGLVIGAATFSGSMVAWGKLANKFKQTPTVLPYHTGWLLLNAAVIVAIGVFAGCGYHPSIGYYLSAGIGLSIIFGILFSIRIGGADMPVLISFLNATAGFAAAFCGIVVENNLLIACGATVAASGSILTHIMCRAMNRNLFKVFIGLRSDVTGDANPLPSATGDKGKKVDPDHKHAEKAGNSDISIAVDAVKASKTVIVVPGYGMAIAGAQFNVAKLATRLEDMGKAVKFAIHPVAGRMPGHMNVLLAEADIDYDQLFEMDDVNPDFQNTDLALVVGACDVVNPAAITVRGTPLSGMPILMVGEARHLVVCNLDENPGYSGVENPLYRGDNTIMLLGDAKRTIENLLEQLD